MTEEGIRRDSRSGRVDRSVTVIAPGQPLSSRDVRAICLRAAAALTRTGADELVCDTAAVRQPNLGTVELLARLRLTTMRSGRPFRILNASDDLVSLLHFTGLDLVLDANPDHPWS